MRSKLRAACGPARALRCRHEHSGTYRPEVLSKRLCRTRVAARARPIHVVRLSYDRGDHEVITQEHLDCAGSMMGVEASRSQTQLSRPIFRRSSPPLHRRYGNFTATKMGAGHPMPPKTKRFLAWQAKRTPGWMTVVERWPMNRGTDPHTAAVEPPSHGFENARSSAPMCLEDPNTGE